MRRARREAVVGMAMLTPVLLLGLVFFVVPIGYVVVQSLTDTPLIGDGTFVGLDNYSQLLHDEIFLSALRFGALFTAMASPVIVFSGYVLGVMTRGSRRLVGVFRSLYLLPYVVGLTTLSYMAVLEFRPGYGAVNQILHTLHITDGQTAWLVDRDLALGAATAVSAWYAVGFGMVLFMTSMQAIPDEMVEAARVDGANWLQRERLVVFPMVRRTLALVSITTVAGSFLAFTQFFILTQGGPGSATSTPVIVAYKTAIQRFRLGYASAMSLVVLILIAGLSLLQFYLLKANSDER